MSTPDASPTSPTSPISSRFGTFLRECRMRRGWSLAKACAASGFPEAVIGSYERNDRIPPTTKLEQLLAAYGFELRPVPIGAGDLHPGEVEHGVRLNGEVLPVTVAGQEAAQRVAWLLPGSEVVSRPRAVLVGEWTAVSQ